MKRVERGIWEKKLADGKRKYVIIYYVNGERHKETVGRDLKLARMKLAERNLEISQAKEAKKYPEFLLQKEILFDNFAEDYLQWSEVNKRSWKRDKQLIANLKTHFAGKHLSGITPPLVENYKAERIQEVKPATVNREVACLKAIFNKAILWGKFKGENPVSKKIKLFKEENAIVRYLSKAEILELLKHCDNKNLLNMVICALNTGMRRSEIFKLKWTDVDLKNGLIRVEYGKNNKQRFIPINAQLEDTLRDIRAEEKTLDCSYVFNHNGNRYTDIKKPFQRTLKKASIENFRFHDLRHTFASHLVMSGVPLNTVRELLGHSTMEMTLRYAHLSNENKKQAISYLQFRYPKVVRSQGSVLGSVSSKKEQKITMITKNEIDLKNSK